MLKSKYLIIDFVWICILFIIIWNSFAIKYNTPEHNDLWSSTKTRLEKSIMGSWSFYKGTQAFANNTLHLDAFFGFQEMVTKREFRPSEISFRTLLTKDAYVYVEYGRKDATFLAYRISVNPLFPSAIIFSKTNGEFFTRKNFNTSLLSDKWYQIKIKFIPHHQQTELYINDIFIISMLCQDNQGSVGFRSGSRSSLIDDVVVKGDGGKLVFKDDFSYRDQQIFNQLLIVLLCLLIFWEFIRFVIRKFTKVALFNLLIFQIILVLISLVVFVMSDYVADKYPQIKGLFSIYWNKKEDDWKAKEIGVVNKKLYSLPPKDTFRVLFVGSSQTWGAGATVENDTFVAQAEQMINIESQGKSKAYELVNAGVSGLVSDEILDFYKNSWKHKLNPDLLVINLATNDKDNPKFENNLRQLITLNQRDSKTMLVLEANSMELEPGEIKNHIIMKRLGKEFQIPVIDLHTYLKTKNDTGIIWWDNVHLTTYGQMLAANLLSNKMLEYINEIRTL
jgi:lysophospholipase L1-like esterase